jgi:mono/diheme cytochrome c family protein
MNLRLIVFVIVIQLPWSGRAADEAYRTTIRPLLDRHCVECHGGGKPKEGLDLEARQPGELSASLKSIQSLDAIALRLRSQSMPPPDSERPLSEADRKALLDWVDAQIDRSLGGEKNPGRVTIRRLTKVDYRNTIRDLLGLDVDTSEFPSDDVAHGFDNLADVISLPPLLMERYADAAESLAKKWWQREVKSNAASRPTSDWNERNTAAGILLPLQQQAFRRTTSELEHHYLLAFFDQCRKQGFDYDQTLQACLTRILVSPAFLFRIEKDGPIGQDYRLDDFELATRLSYFIWSSMPDVGLFELARRGELQKGDNLKQQVQRMLRDPKVRQGLVENFAGQWLQTQRLRAIRPDRKAFADFNDELRDAMEQETLRLFEAIVREDRPITELLDADYTFVNQQLAQHYGISGVKANSWQRVSLANLPRRGVITHASILAINAHPTRTSPVLRGKWIMEAILGTPPPPPPADVSELEAVTVTGTLRQRLEAHRANPRCASCHDRMDALGLALENFDAVGRWRTRDGNLPIDAAGKLPDGGQFNDALGLVTLLREKHTAAFRKNLSERILVYALGRTLGMYDRLPLRRVVTQTADAQDRFSSLVLAIAESDVFRLRRNPGRIGVEKLAEQFVFDLSGNPDQQSILKLRRNPHANPPSTAGQAAFELHTLKPLLSASTASGGEVVVGKPAGGPQVKQAYRYPITAPIDEPVYLSFLKGMIGPTEYSDEFLKPIAAFEPTDEAKILTVAHSSHAWNGLLAGPANVRPGSLMSFDFDVRLVAKPNDRVHLYLATTGGVNTSMILNAGPFAVEGEGLHRLTQVGRRNPTTHDAWNNNITLVIETRTQTVIENVSPIRVVRPQLGLSDAKPIRFAVAVGQTPESEERRVFNSQMTTMTDHNGTIWRSVLYGVSRVKTDPKRPYFMETEHAGLELIGEHADRFELVGTNTIDGGRAIKLVGADKQTGLEGGPEPESESFTVRFRGADTAGTYRAVVRVVTQAGNAGMPSNGEQGEPAKGFCYVEIPVEAIVK